MGKGEGGGGEAERKEQGKGVRREDKKRDERKSQEVWRTWSTGENWTLQMPLL